MATYIIHTSFAGGEIDPALWGHVDLQKFDAAAATLRNMFVSYRGGAVSRAGTAYVGRSKQRADLGQMQPRLIPFSFSISQDYVLEFGDNYVRIVTNGAFVTEAPLTVTGATQADPCVVSYTGGTLNAGDWVFFSGVGGMTELNGNTFIVGATGVGTISLQDLDGNNLDSTAYNAYTSGGTVARIYTIVSPYTAAQAWNLKYKQSADVLTFTHPDFPPYDLSRFGPVNWTFAAVSIASSLPAPATCSVTATVTASGSNLATAYAYVVTAVDPKTGEESQPSVIGNVLNSVDISAVAGSLVVEWSAVTGAAFYKIYKAPPSYATGTATTADPVPAGSLFGFVGTSFGTQFVDTNITADFTQTPPKHQNPIAPGQILAVTSTFAGTGYTTAAGVITSGTGSGAVLQPVIVSNGVVAWIVVNAGTGYLDTDTITVTGDGTGATAMLSVGPSSGTYPSGVSYFQQRRDYFNSLNLPDTYWMSQPGAFDNFDVSVPVGASDAITGTPNSEKVDGIQWMIEMPLGLLTFTASGVFQVTASGTFISSPSAITPTNQTVVPQSSIGSTDSLEPTRIDRDILYWEPDNATLRDLQYQIYFNLYTSADISWQSKHLTEGKEIVQTIWCRSPHYLFWMVRDDGLLLSLTYLKEQEVLGWARHTTQGMVRSVSSAFEVNTDILYLVAERFVPQTGTRYFIERMAPRIWESVDDAFCVDCGVATVLETRSAKLYASKGSGIGAQFNATAAVFSAADVGKIIRMGGGIAKVTAFNSVATVTGDWYFPCAELITDDPNAAPVPQNAGDWTITPQVASVSLPPHLIGRQIVGLADGVPIGPFTPAGQTLALPFPASNVNLGLAYTAQVQSVYLNTNQAPTDQGRRKSISAVTVRCKASSPMQAGANEADSSAQNPPPFGLSWSGMPAAPNSPAQYPATYTTPGGGTAQPLFTGDIRIPIPSDWKKPGQVAVQQTAPLPLIVTAVIPEVLEGDMPEIAYSPQQAPQAQRRGPRGLFAA